MITKGNINRVMPMIMALKAHGNDYDSARYLIERICEIFYGKEKAGGMGFEEKLAAVNESLKPIKKRVFKVIWMWPKWGEWWWPRRLWVRQENFADTKGIELSMANIYFLRFTDVIKNSNNDEAKYKKAMGDFIGHLVIRKRWSWRKMRMERLPYHSKEVLELGHKMLGLPAGVQYWLINYFEDSLRFFVRMFSEVFGGEGDGDDKPSMFKNGEGWIAILEDVALQGAYGDFNKVCETEAVTIWLFLKHQKIKVDNQVR